MSVMTKFTIMNITNPKTTINKTTLIYLYLLYYYVKCQLSCNLLRMITIPSKCTSGKYKIITGVLKPS